MQIAHLAACSGSPYGLGRAARGVRICETRLFQFIYSLLVKGLNGHGCDAGMMMAGSFFSALSFLKENFNHLQLGQGLSH